MRMPIGYYRWERTHEQAPWRRVGVMIDRIGRSDAAVAAWKENEQAGYRKVKVRPVYEE